MDLLKHPSEELEKRGKVYISAVANRVNEFLTDKNVIYNEITQKRYAKF